MRFPPIKSFFELSVLRDKRLQLRWPRETEEITKNQMLKFFESFNWYPYISII